MAKKRKSSTRTTYTADEVISAIKGSGGVKTTIAKRLGVTRQTVDNYLDRWVTVKDAYIEEKQGIDDAAVSVVMQDIVRNQNVQTAKWWIERKLDEFKPKQDVHIKDWRQLAEQMGADPDTVDRLLDADADVLAAELFTGDK